MYINCGGIEMNFSNEKRLICEYFSAMEAASAANVESVLSQYVDERCDWRGVFPFRNLKGLSTVAEKFWKPLKQSFNSMQRRQDIFIAGINEIEAEKREEPEVWVMSMGNFMGLFDNPWLGIASTGRMANLRYAEFNCVKDGKIVKTGIFLDIIGLMQQAGCRPLPESTGVFFNYPGPRNHDGLVFGESDPTEGEKTLELVDKMIQDLSDLNDSGSIGCPPEMLEKSWSEEMIWYGPAGVGATYTIPRYQKQHQLPFRNNLDDKKFVGHVCRFAEGKFACFFGWPNLTNSPLGGWLGLPGGGKDCEMQVVDVYCREGDKLSENWVFIDIPYWLKQQGLDIFKRNREIHSIG